MGKICKFILGISVVLASCKKELNKSLKPINQPVLNDNSNTDFIESYKEISASKSIYFSKEHLYYFEERINRIDSLDRIYGVNSAWVVYDLPIDSTRYKENIYKSITYQQEYLPYYNQAIMSVLNKKVKYNFKNPGVEGPGSSLVSFDLIDHKTKQSIATNSHFCHDIFIENESRGYKTIEYGCCSRPDRYKLFDLNGTQIAESMGDFCYIQGNLKNQPIRLRIGSYHIKESSRNNMELMMSINYESNDSILNSHFIKFDSKKYSVENKNCYWGIPPFQIYINNKSVDYKVEQSTGQLDDIELEVVVERSYVENNKHNDKGDYTIKIPFVNGHPFGKTDELIIVNVDKLQPDNQ